jgi:cytochrome c oxidase cbb3-type subunit 3
MNGDERESVEYPRADLAVRDGIGEEDNKVPLWFNVGFYGLIAVGIVYIFYYTLSGWSAEGEYRAQVDAAEATLAAQRAELPAANPFRGDVAALGQGQEVFAQICAACHKVDGSGLVGPSLVDPYWKYGDSDQARFTSVSEGRPEGMPPWGKVLGSEKIWKVLAYVETLPRSAEPGVGAPGVAAPGMGAPGVAAPGG